MLFRLLLLFILVPLAELAILLWIAEVTDNWLFTLALVIVTGMVGAWLARREGLRCLRQIRRQLARGQLPGDSLLDGLMILIAGALLITPGVLTDLLGFALLVPTIRRVLKQYLKRRIQARIVIPPGSPDWNRSPPRDEIIDVRIVDDQERTPHDK